MVLRGGRSRARLLDRMWSSERLIDHPWWENAALLDALGYDLPGALEPGWAAGQRLRRAPAASRAASVPPRPSPFLDGTQFLPLEWNSVYLDRAQRPRIVHCLGVPVEQRVRDMRAALR